MLHWTVYLKEGPKVFHDAAVSVGHKVYSFGGYDASNTKLDQLGVKIFNTVSLLWTNLPPVTDGREERPLEVPNMCWGHTAVLIEDVVYIWGGFKHSVVLYAFDVNTNRWFRPGVSRAVPEARCNHSACVLGTVMYVHGGYTQLNGRTNDILKLDTTTMVWSLINTGGTLAPVSLCHSATIIGTKMFVFGGRGAMGHYNNIRVFDTDTSSWLRTPSAQLLPEGRGWHSAFAYNDELYIFGGDNLDQTFSDLWKFNPDAFSWKNVAPKGKGPCVMTGMCCCTVGDHIILFGGYRYTYDDLYILDLSPSLKTLCKLTVIQYGLEHSGLVQDIRSELVAMTTNNNHDNQKSLPASPKTKRPR